MAQRLVKVAKELNVGTSTLVEFLTQNGFEIDNKPTAKVSDEMYDALVKEFQSSMAVKEQAEKLILGNRSSEKTEEPKVASKPVVSTPSPKEEKVVEKAIEKPTEKVVEEKKESEEIAAEAVETEGQIGVKVVGKIDLAPKPKKATKKEEEPKEEDKEVGEEKVEEIVEEAVEVVEETKTEVEEEKVEEVIKADAPQLKGLKVQGKIDIAKFDKPKKPATKESESSDTDSDAAKKRKRKRKTIVTPVGRKGDNRRGDGNKQNRKGGKKKVEEEVKQVSQKEIDEKIKATMARLSGSGGKKRQKIRRDKRETIREREEIRQMEAEDQALQVTEFISAQELANLMDVPVTDIIMTCMNMGVIVSINQRLDAEIIELVATEFGHEINFVGTEEEDEEFEIIDSPEDLEPRAPIVTVMGHVDHGKTSLLDYIRSATVAEGEAGGITQHIGAYEVKVGPDNRKITFLDTPGHEAFTAMRARGAKVTDIVIIIISADDRIMPQTKEAISHSQAAGVPIIFAINKIDKEGADPNRIKQELAEMDLLVEEWGGKYQSQDISAKTGQNIEELLEKVLLESELLELKANPNRLAVGAVLEASLEKGRGYVCKTLIQNGTLKIGDPILAGEHAGRVKAMFNDKGERIKVAGPATPIALLGLSGAPQAGERFRATETEQEAKSVAVKRAQIVREQTTRSNKRISLDEIGRRLALGNFKELNLIVKGDVDGSVEALSDSLIKLSVETIQVNVIHKAVGQIIESDILLASASDAIVIGFQVRPSAGARKLAENEGVEIKTYSVIYQAIDEIKMAMEGMLEPTKEEKVVAQLTVRETFKISKIGTIAGCIVDEGLINRNSSVRIIREGIVVYPTKEGAAAELSSLKRFKDDVKEVKSGMECGLTVKNFNDIKVGDVIEGYEIVEIAQSLD